MSGMESWMTTKEAAEYLGVSPSRIRQLIMDGVLTATKRGRDNWIERDQVERHKVERAPRGRPRKEQS